jgi:hypothetical protein
LEFDVQSEESPDIREHQNHLFNSDDKQSEEMIQEKVESLEFFKLVEYHLRDQFKTPPMEEKETQQN